MVKGGKMARWVLPVLLISSCFLLNGCALFTRDKTDDLQRQINSLRMEFEELRDDNDKKLEQLKSNQENLSARVQHLIEEKQRLSQENQDLTSRLDGIGGGSRKVPTVERTTEAPDDFKVKVLSGNGDINSAKEMAKKLSDMGYEVGRVGHATRSNFARNTVFFSDDAQEEARRLVSVLGGETVMRPITWSSSYNIIVVTGLSQ